MTFLNVRRGSNLGLFIIFIQYFEDENLKSNLGQLAATAANALPKEVLATWVKLCFKT